MISKEFSKIQLQKLNDQFNFIFSNNSVSSAISSDQTLQSILKECLSIHALLESSSKTTKKNNKLFVEKYNKLSKEKFTLSKVNYDNETDILDQLNWMKVYLENTYNVNILSHSVSAAPAPAISEKTTKILQEEKIVSATAGGDLNPDKLLELSQKMQRVNERLNKDISTGKLYIFKTKPKHIVLVKKIYSYLLAGLSFSIFVAAIFMFVLENTRLATGGTWIAWTDGLFALFMCGACTMMAVQSFMSLYSKKLCNNDNIKYQFKWQISILMIILILFYILNLCVSLDGENIFHYVFNTVLPSNPNWKVEIYIFIGSICAIIAFYVFTLVPFIMAAVLNPKRDDKAIETKMTEYLKDPTV